MSAPSPSSHPRGVGKIAALLCAGGSFTCAILALGLSLWFWMNQGFAHVYTASSIATTFFFFSTAVALYVMSRPRPRLPQDA